MATFIVGNTRKVFNFGTSKVWDFSEAYRNASDGDVIQFQAGTAQTGWFPVLFPD